MRMRTAITLLLAPLLVAAPAVAQSSICIDGECHEIPDAPGGLVAPPEPEEGATPPDDEAGSASSEDAPTTSDGSAEASPTGAESAHAVDGSRSPTTVSWPAVQEYFYWLPAGAWPYVELGIGALLTGVVTLHAFFAAGSGSVMKIGKRLAWLGFLPFMLLFSRIHSNKVLEQPVRRKLMNAIEADAGLDVDDLADATGVSWSTARHHLRHLETHNLVRSVRSGKKRLYFAAGTDESRHRKDVAALGGRARRRVARAVLDAPGTTNAEIANDLGIKPPSVSHHLHALMEAGFVVAEKMGRQQCLTPTDRLKAILRPADAGQVVLPPHLQNRGSPVAHPSLS